MLWAAGQISQGRDVDDVLEQVAPVLNKAPAVEAVRAYAADLDSEH
jgi:hypothetical protein